MEMKKRTWKNGKLYIIVILLFVVIIASLNSPVFAKYYANSSNKGVGTASAWYFDSNLLKVLGADNEYKSIYNPTEWSGEGSYSFTVQVRNYEGQLLYNDENLNITHNIIFELVDAEANESVQIGYVNGDGVTTTETLTASKSSFVLENQLLEGGVKRYNEYTITMLKPAGADDTSAYMSPGVKVTVEVTAPEYLAGTKGKRLGGIFYASVFSASYSLTGLFDFTTTGEGSFKEQLASNFATVTYKPGIDNAAHEIELSWEEGMLQLDRFSEYYNSVESDTITDSSGNKKKISKLTLILQPMSVTKFVFYCGSGWNTEGIDSKEDLDGLITIVDKTREGTE